MARVKRLTLAEQRLVASMYFEPKYSGAASEKFWSEIGRAEDDNLAIYQLGCALQDLETRVLSIVNDLVYASAADLVISQRPARRKQVKTAKRSVGKTKPGKP